MAVSFLGKRSKCTSDGDISNGEIYISRCATLMAFEPFTYFWVIHLSSGFLHHLSTWVSYEPGSGFICDGHVSSMQKCSDTVALLPTCREDVPSIYWNGITRQLRRLVENLICKGKLGVPNFAECHYSWWIQGRIMALIAIHLGKIDAKKCESWIRRWV